MGRWDEQLFTAVADEASQRLKDFNSQDLANTAWAFVTVGRKDEQLLTAVAEAAKQRVTDFDSQELVNTAWSLMDSAACTLGS